MIEFDKCYAEARKIVADDSKRLKNILDAMGDGLSIQDRKMRIVYQNQFMIDHFGSHIGDYCYNIYENRNRTCDGCPLVEVFRTGKVATALRVGITKDGTPLCFEITASPLRNDRGEIIAGMESCRSVEDRDKRACGDLKIAWSRALQHEELLRATIEAAPTAIIDLDLDGNVRSIWNRAAERMLGWNAREVMGRPLPTVPKGKEEEFRRFLEQTRKGLTLNGVEVCRKKRDGTPIDYSIYASPLYDAGGHIVGNVAVLVDITERKQTMDALRNSETRLQDIIDCTSDWIWETDATAAYTFCSGRIHNVLGYQPEEVVGRTPYDLMAPEEREPARESLVELSVRKAPIVSHERWFLAKDGRRVCLLTNGVPIVDGQGRLVGYRGADQDITERKLLEDQLRSKNEDLERSNAELGHFAYIASHHLQEPLRKVSCYLELLAERYHDKLDHDAHDFIEYAVDGALRMKDLINDLLFYSRIDSRKKSFKPIESAAVLKKVLMALESFFREENVVVRHSKMPVVAADEAQLEQLFLNLIHNAVKYGNRTPVLIDISAEKKGDAWRFSVKDNGIGIEPRFQARLFDMFQRLHGIGEYSGTGIGLSICKKIVERHGGTIGLESAPGRGSTFYFTIPDQKKSI